MLNNIVPIEELAGLARARARDYETRTVNPALVDQLIADGWTIDKRNKKSVRLRKPKSHSTYLEDRVWVLFYRMRFPLLSGKGGAELVLEPKNPESPTSQIDVAALDSEIAIAIECKSSENLTKRPQFQNDLAKHGLIRERFTASARSQFSTTHKRQIVLAMFLSNILLTDNDRTRAKDQNIILFDEHDLDYYEHLVSHLGPAARYQFLADMLPGKTLPGLELRLPAIKTKMGGEAAERVRREIEARLALGDVSFLTQHDNAVPVFGAFADRWLADYARVECKTSTADGYEGVLRQYLRPRFATKRLNEIRRDDVKALINELVTKDLSRNTVRNALCVIRGIFNEAIEAGIRRSKPCCAPGAVHADREDCRSQGNFSDADGDRTVSPGCKRDLS